MNILQLISIGLEFFVAVLGILLAVRKKKVWGWAVLLTFGIYVFYDLANLLQYSASNAALRLSFFIATLSILMTFWQIYQET
jgi:hypothetical protein